MVVVARFPWEVDKAGYEWVEVESVEVEAGRWVTAVASDSIEIRLFLLPVIAPGPHEVEVHYPLQESLALYRILADTPATTEGILGFARKYGPLGGNVARIIQAPRRGLAKPYVGYGESLASWEREIRAIREAVALWDLLANFSKGDVIGPAWDALRKGVNRHMEGRVNLTMFKSADGDGLTLGCDPEGLIGALWLQLALAIGDGRFPRQCSECGRWFEPIPHEGRRGRTDRQYCSNYCRAKRYQKRISEARGLDKQGVPAAEIAQRLDAEVDVVKGWISSQPVS